jgi:hypothetical protein
MALDARTEERLLRLLDEREIHDVLTRYCRGVDRCDRELMSSCYHPDARDDHGNWQVSGAEAAQHIFNLVKPGDDVAMHFLGNVRIEVEGETAFAESYVLAFRSFNRDERPYTRTRAVRFIDRFTLRNGQWRISERVVTDDWNRVDEVIEAQSDTKGFRNGTKDRDDPVYAIRRGPLARSKLAARE